MNRVKATLFSLVDLMTDEINGNIRLGTQVSTLELAIRYGELQMEEL